MTADNFCFYFQNRLIQTSETGGQWYSDTSPFSIPCIHIQPLIRLLITLAIKHPYPNNYHKVIVSIGIPTLGQPSQTFNDEVILLLAKCVIVTKNYAANH